jgi:hypothetical protein
VFDGLDRCSVAGVPPEGFRCAACFCKKFHRSTIFITDSFIEHVTSCLQTLAHLKGRDFYVNTYLRPCIVSYFLFLRRNSVVYRHVCFAN